MKFFKHFTDAHRGSSLKILRKKYGMAAIGRYWVFVELCAEKMNKERDEEYTEQHAKFSFEKTYLMECLGYANLKQASSYLEALAELGLCSLHDMGDIWACSMPKLLECIDRDNNRARPARASVAPKNKIKNKNKSLDDSQKINWIEEANNCFQAVSSCPTDYAAEQWLGSSRMPYVNQIGGVKFIRALKNNDFEVKRIAERLEIAWKLLNSNQESA